jgi:hypothetical protein
MGDVRTQEMRVHLSWPMDVVGVLAPARDESLILEAAHRGPDTRRCHIAHPPTADPDVSKSILGSLDNNWNLSAMLILKA